MAKKAFQTKTRTLIGHVPSRLLNTVLSDASIRVVAIGLVTNAAMAIVKASCGWLLSSQTLTADGLHSFTDLFEGLLTLSAVWGSTRSQASGDWMHSTLARVGAVCISAMLLGIGVTTGWRCLTGLLCLVFPGMKMGASMRSFADDGHAEDIGGLPTAMISLFSIVLKEWLYRITLKVAHQTKSTVLASTAVHHRSDAIGSLVALIVAILAAFSVERHLSWLDGAGGLIISSMMLKAVWDNTWVLLSPGPE